MLAECMKRWTLFVPYLSGRTAHPSTGRARQELVPRTRFWDKHA